MSSDHAPNHIPKAERILNAVYAAVIIVLGAIGLTTEGTPPGRRLWRGDRCLCGSGDPALATSDRDDAEKSERHQHPRRRLRNRSRHRHADREVVDGDAVS